MSKIQDSIFNALDGSAYDRGRLEELQAETRMLKVYVARLTEAIIKSGIDLNVENLLKGISFNDGEFKE